MSHKVTVVEEMTQRTRVRKELRGTIDRVHTKTELKEWDEINRTEVA